jgi:PRTRC genetic system protein E
MFVELMPLLANRTVLITVAKVDDKTLRVNVIPDGKADDNPALSTPLTCTGSPEELDAELGRHLVGYAGGTGCDTRCGREMEHGFLRA